MNRRTENGQKIPILRVAAQKRAYWKTEVEKGKENATFLFGLFKKSVGPDPDFLGQSVPAAPAHKSTPGNYMPF